MRLQPSREFTAEPGSVAMTDMVLNMFIFFFISFSLLYTFSPERLARIPVKPPHVSPAAATQSLDRSLVITMDHTGLIYVGEEPVTLSTLPAVMATRLEGAEQTTVLLRADRLVTIQEVVRVMELAKASGAQQVSIAVVKQTQPIPRIE